MSTEPKYDVCIIGSGAGGSPIAYTLAKQGRKVVVLEKGSWYDEKDFSKDELSTVRRSVYTPKLQDEFHVIEDEGSEYTTKESGNSFWNGNCVGGSSNFMSGYFHRLKPKDFRLLSEFGPIKGANISDWPISYDDLEPYYTKVESLIGVSGKITNHSFLEPRSTKNFPYPPLRESEVTKLVDSSARSLGFSSIPVARAILTLPKDKRNPCYLSNFCGSYGCNSGAKGSARAALLNDAIATNNCKIIPNSMVFYLKSNSKNQITSAKYYDADGAIQEINAKIFIVACQAIETSRLLLNSKNKYHPDGIGNKYNQLGKNLIFSAGGTGGGTLLYSDYAKDKVDKLTIEGPFINRSILDWYYYKESKDSELQKGGLIDFLFDHANGIRRAEKQKWENGEILWGKKLQDKLHKHFNQGRYVKFEVFNDWLPNDNCSVTLSNKKDKWKNKVAKVRVGAHEHDLKVAKFLTNKAKKVLEKMNLKDIHSSVSSSPPPNLVAGGCRFGSDPKNSYLDANCKVHLVDNLYVSDASFMPTGGSVPYTWTIYANSFRIADVLLERL